MERNAYTVDRQCQKTGIASHGAVAIIIGSYSFFPWPRQTRGESP